MAKGLKFVRGKVKAAAEVSLKAIRNTETNTVRISGYANTPVKDRYGEIVDVVAFASSLERFMKNPVMLWSHSMRDVIGLWDEVSIKPEGLYVSGVIHTQFDLGATIAAMAEAGLIRGLSIGFIELSGEWDKEEDAYHITDLDLLEISPVAIPANQEALFRVDTSGKCTSIILLPEGATAEQAKGLADASGGTKDPDPDEGKTETVAEQIAGINATIRNLVAGTAALAADLATAEDAVRSADGKSTALEGAMPGLFDGLKKDLHDELATQLATVADTEEILATVMDYIKALDARLGKLEQTQADARF
jgi:hypothetical protein